MESLIIFKVIKWKIVIDSHIFLMSIKNSLTMLVFKYEIRNRVKKLFLISEKIHNVHAKKKKILLWCTIGSINSQKWILFYSNQFVLFNLSFLPDLWFLEWKIKVSGKKTRCSHFTGTKAYTWRPFVKRSKLGCRGEEDGRGRGQVRGALDAKGKGWRRMDRG